MGLTSIIGYALMLAVDILSFLTFGEKNVVNRDFLCFFIGYDYEYLVFYDDHPWHCRR